VLGLGFLISAAYLFPLTIVFLTLALAALAFKAKSVPHFAKPKTLFFS
jgi:hypothetical protein